MDRNAPNNPFARYADDAVIHCRNKREAEELLSKLEQRFRECKLELHPDKTRIVYCKDSNRSGEYPVTKFDFLGYTFRPRLSRSKQGNFFGRPALQRPDKRNSDKQQDGFLGKTCYVNEPGYPGMGQLLFKIPSERSKTSS